MNIECTPEEARVFMGLPDVQPLQDAVMRELQDQMTTNLRLMSPESMMKNWLPNGLQGAEQAQKLFWDSVQKAFANVLGPTGAMLTFTPDIKKTK